MLLRRTTRFLMLVGSLPGKLSPHGSSMSAGSSVTPSAAVSSSHMLSSSAAPKKAAAHGSTTSASLQEAGMDHRERIIEIFMEMQEINAALGESYKAASYATAIHSLQKTSHIPILTMEDTTKVSGVGIKLALKMGEIVRTGGLQELEKLRKVPIVEAIQDITRIHGFGPKTALLYVRKGITSVKQLVQNQEKLELTDGQKLGLKYYKDIELQIPHAEGRLQEAYLKLRLRSYLGPGFELQLCGSYRRKKPMSGDIDVLITRRPGSGKLRDSVTLLQAVAMDGAKPTDAKKVVSPLSDQAVMERFIGALQKEKYIEGTLAQGSTKFMGICRLKTYGGSPARGKPAKKYPARRIDIRLVDTVSFPSALLYFTGSKNFNVKMRTHAIKKGFLLNEYGLFRGSSTEHLFKQVGGHGLVGKNGAKMSKEKQKLLDQVWKQIESKRVKVRCEKDIFDAIGMPYLTPKERDI